MELTERIFKHFDGPDAIWVATPQFSPVATDPDGYLASLHFRGVIFSHEQPPITPARAQPFLPYPFRLLDAAGAVVARGYCSDRSSTAPLDDEHLRAAGAIRIEYFDTGRYVDITNPLAR